MFAGVVACALWRVGLIDSLRSAFVLGSNRVDTLIITPQPWLGALLIVAVSLSAGFFVGRVGVRRSFLILGLGFLAMAAASLLISRYINFDILFAPMALGSIAAVFLVQIHRLWQIDIVLTNHVNETQSRSEIIEESFAQSRLTSGLKLLQTILPLE